MRFLFLLTLFTVHAFSQNKYTISGFVSDDKTGEELIGATVMVTELTSTGFSTNAYGFYSLTIPKGKYTVSAQFVGYETFVTTVILNENQKLNFRLKEKITELDEVVITKEKHNDNVVKPQMGTNKISIQEIKTIPSFLGERDVLKAIQLLPGVKSAGEGNSGFYVRGGGSDQNLILLDEATVYNASHLLGFFSVFNPDAIKDASIYKGTMPAEYGGRLSSVLNLSMNDGNNKEYVVNGGIGLISSRLTIEGPIVKDKSSFIISGRRTYADLIAKLYPDTTVQHSTLYFYDLNAKVNYRINEDNRLYISGYFGKDVLGLYQSGINWGNTTATLRWNHLFNDKLFSNLSVIYSDYNYTINNGSSNIPINIISNIQDWNVKDDLQFFPGSKSQMKFGFNSIYHTFIPGTILNADSNINRRTLPNKYAWENAAYVSTEYKFNGTISVNFGVRLTSFSLLGPGTFYTYNADDVSIDSAEYKSGQIVKSYYTIEPRLAITYLINEENSIKASYNRNTQNLHLLSNSLIGSPTDLWVPSSNNIKPEISDQVSLGYFRNLKENLYEFSAEVYYKTLRNQIDYQTGARLNFNANVESQLINGSGRAYGLELYLKKRYGKLNGWISYTLARTERKFPGVNFGNYYPSKQDRSHDISIAAIYDYSKKLTFSATWVYYTGNAVTFPSGKYEVYEQVLNYYTARNGYRMPSYQRLDLGLTYYKKQVGKYESYWTFSVYNAYAYDNAYSIVFRQSEKDPTKTVAVQTTLFRLVPSVTYNFKF
jgi:hypothetical protein